MSNLLPALLAAGLVMISALVPASAQTSGDKKRSCQDICTQRCEMSSYGKNLCMPSCMSKCNIAREKH
jgi:hypothetical protein